MSQLYGLEGKLVNKTVCVEKTANTLLPLSYICKTDSNCTLLSRAGISKYSFPNLSNATIETEKPWKHDKYLNLPPNDIAVHSSSETIFFEAKIVLYKGTKTELILRQDCYSCNCIVSVVHHNPELACESLQELLSDTATVETPYLLVFLWNDISMKCDLLVVTDVALLQMIQDSKSARCTEAIKLIDKTVLTYKETGKVIYRQKKSDVVPHRKVSLFPFREEPLKSFSLSFIIDIHDLVQGDISPDTSLWNKIVVCKLQQKILELEKKLNSLTVEL